MLANSVTRGEHGDPFADTRTVIGKDDGRPIYLFSTDSPLRSTDGDFEAMALYAGTGVDRVGTITGAAERVERIVAEAEALLAVDASPSATSGRMSSAPCFAAEVGTQGEFNQSLQHVLTGDADRDSERTAGGRTRWRTHRAAHGRGCTRRPTTGARHPARRGALVCLARPGDQHLGGMPSRRTGDFYAKAMAIDELPARFAFLNHGQRWVVRRLQALLPQVRDPHLQAKLQAMGAAHEDNIKRLAALLDA